MEAIAIGLLWAASVALAFRIGHAIGHALGMWGPRAMIRMNALHASSFEAGKRVGIALGKQEK